MKKVRQTALQSSSLKWPQNGYSDGPNKRAMDMYGKLIHYETLAKKSQNISYIKVEVLIKCYFLKVIIGEGLKKLRKASKEKKMMMNLLNLNKRKIRYLKI